LDTDVFALLVAYGQDVAGAVVVGDEIAERPYAFAEAYDEQTLLDEVGALASHDRPLAVHDDSELSIAGLQDKMLLVLTEDGQWARPVHGFPSTHILKVDDRMHRGLVIAEHTCLQIARAAQLSAAASEVMQFGDLMTIVIERFDRVRQSQSSAPQRIHQEDACQALGVDLELTQGRAKYETGQGLSLRAIAELLSAWGDDEQLLHLLDRLVFTVLIGDADAHGKNIAFLHSGPGRIALAPLYDTVPTALWPNLRTSAAMSIRGAVDMSQIDRTDIVREAGGWGVDPSIAFQRVNETAERILSAAQTVTLVDDQLATRTVAFVEQTAHRLLTTRPL
jgi:serine/threonine-protein kinase HipA